MTMEWLLAAALAGGLTTTAPAAPRPHTRARWWRPNCTTPSKPEAQARVGLAALACASGFDGLSGRVYQEHERPAVRVELRGRLEAAAPVAGPGGDARQATPFQYAITADGRRFHLQMTGEQGKGASLDVQVVVVTGELDLDTVRVRELRHPLDDALVRYARVTATGRLELLRRADRDEWQLRVEGRIFSLELADDTAHAEAQKALSGHDGRARGEGELKDGRIVVRAIKAYPVRR